MEKKRVSVQIEGRSYAVITFEERSYVHSVADEVIRAIRRAAQTGRHLDTRDCAIMAAMDFCDVIDKADQIIRQSGELGKQCREYKERLAAAINENTTLTKRIKTLEDQLHTLMKENEKLKKGETKALENEKKFEKTVRDKKTEKLMGYVPMRQYSLFEEKDVPPKKDE